MADTDTTPTPPEVVSQEGALVGDEAMPDPREVSVDVNANQVDAQVSPPRAPDASKVYVHETSVKMDEVILDPASPLAVQIPDAGRGVLDLPIHDLSGPRPEDVFASEASKAKSPSDKERQAAAAEGRLPNS